MNFIQIRISALQFRIYVEVLVQIWLVFYTVKIKKTLYDQSYGLTTPLLDMYYYVKLSFKNKVLQDSNDAKLWAAS